MSEELKAVRNALVEAVTAQKLIEDKLKKAKEDLAKWQKRLTDKNALAHIEAADEITQRIRQLELMIAEFEADLMAQQDLESQLKQTIHRLEHAVPSAQIPVLGNINQADETIDRLENKIVEKEIYADLLTADRDQERKLEKLAQETALDDELAALKKKVKDENDDEADNDIKLIVSDDSA